MYINFIGVGVVFIYWPVSPLVSIIAPSKGDLFITCIVKRVVPGFQMQHYSGLKRCSWTSGEYAIEVQFWVRFSVLSSSSYLHCQWASVEELDKDKRIQQKIKRFKAKQGQNKFLSEVCLFGSFRYLRDVLTNSFFI